MTRLGSASLCTSTARHATHAHSPPPTTPPLFFIWRRVEHRLRRRRFCWRWARAAPRSSLTPMRAGRMRRMRCCCCCCRRLLSLFSARRSPPPLRCCCRCRCSHPLRLRGRTPPSLVGPRRSEASWPQSARAGGRGVQERRRRSRGGTCGEPSAKCNVWRGGERGAMRRSGDAALRRRRCRCDRRTLPR